MLTRYFVRRPVVVAMTLFVLIAGGVLSWHSLRRALLPDSEPERLAVVVKYPGASPEEVDTLVTRLLEPELRDTPGVEEVIATSHEGASLLALELRGGWDLDRARHEVRRRIDLLAGDLPEEVEPYQLREIETDYAVTNVVLHGDVDETALRRAALDLRDELRALPGVSEIEIRGVRDRELRVEAEPHRLEAHRLSLAEIAEAIARSNRDLAGGLLEDRTSSLGVRTPALDREPGRLERLVVRASPSGASVRVGDAGRVVWGFEDQVNGVGFQGQRAALLAVYQSDGEDVIDIAKRVRRCVEERPTRLGGAVHLRVVLDLSRFIEERIDLMMRNGAQGLVLVMLTLSLCLGLRFGFWVAAGIPVSFLGTFLLMRGLDLTVDMVSLVAFIIVLGLIVDDAIVVGESIYTCRRKGLSPEEASVHGVLLVALPVLTTVLTTVAAFVPMTALGGKLGRMIGVIPIVVPAALLVSLVDAFFLLPSHLARGGCDDEGTRGALWRGRILEGWLPDAAGAIASWCVRWRYVCVSGILALALLAAGLVVGGRLPFVLVDRMDAEVIVVTLQTVPGTPREETARIASRLETMFREQPEIERIVTLLGADRGTHRLPPQVDGATFARLLIELTGAGQRLRDGMRDADSLLEAIRPRTRAIGSIESLEMEARTGLDLGMDIELRLMGESTDLLEAARDHVRTLLSAYPAVIALEDDLSRGRLEYRMRPGPRASALGLTAGEIGLQLRHALHGAESQQIQVGDDRVTVRVGLAGEKHVAPSELDRLRLRTRTGAGVPLAEAARTEVGRGFASIVRVDGARTVTVRADVDESRDNAAAISSDLLERLGDLGRRFPGVRLEVEGKGRETRESLESLGQAYLIAMLSIYALLVMLFGSYTQPLVVLCAVPLSWIGVVAGHLLMGFRLSFPSCVGIAALSGIVVNDAVVLVDYINRLRRDGIPMPEAVVLGSRRRVRAILLTSLTTIAGLAPLMFESSFQAQWLIPLALTLVFGLAFATVVTLVFIPAGAIILEDLRRSGQDD